MPAAQSEYMETSWTVLALRNTASATGINAYWLCNGTSRRQWVGTIMTCIDLFNKMVVLVSLYETDAQTVTSCFLAQVMSHHGLPGTIISNRDPRFQGSFWKELLANLNT